jgi:PAS domain-containing protein
MARRRRPGDSGVEGGWNGPGAGEGNFRKDGSRVPVLVGAANLEGTREEGVALVLDLSERKRAEYLARLVFETSPDRISIVGCDYRWQRANPAMERRWGYTGGEVYRQAHS